MSLTIKAFLYERTWRGDPIEIRRFTVDQDVSSSYAYLLEKVVQVFPSLQVNNVLLAWTDSDGDVISISSDEELVEALDQFEGNIFRLYLKKRNIATQFAGAPPSSAPQPGQSEQENPSADTGPSDNPNSTTQGSFHPGVLCDGCNGPIYGTRFKCLVCRDYDLCSSCEGKGVHVDHNMVSIVDPWSYHPWGFHGWPHGGFGGFGPFRGGRGCGFHRGGRFGCRPYHHHGGRGGYPGWQRGGPAASCHGCQPGAEKQGERQEPMDTANPGSSEADRKSFLQGLGEAVSSFLEPFGVKVDVDAVGGEKPAESQPSADTSSAANAEAEVSSEVVESALAQLKSMGYQDEEGWLKELVQAKGGDVAKVLDALHPTAEQD